MVLLSIFYVILLIESCYSAHFGNIDERFDYYPYSPYGPHQWGGVCNTGNLQSPINLVKSEAMYTNLDNVFMSEAYNYIPSNMNVMNNEHTIEILANAEEELSISMGPLPDSAQYTFLQLHFHWAFNNSQGSEHTILGTHYAMEAHAVHRNPNSAEGENSIAVLGYFFQISPNPNPTIEKILTALAKDSTVDVEIPMEPFALSEIVKPFEHYITYSGSLTTPPCTETVQWIIPYMEILKISQQQLDRFRKIARKYPSMKDNFRPVQPLNDRVLYYN